MREVRVHDAARPQMGEEDRSPGAWCSGLGLNSNTVRPRERAFSRGQHGRKADWLLAVVTMKGKRLGRQQAVIRELVETGQWDPFRGHVGGTSADLGCWGWGEGKNRGGNLVVDSELEVPEGQEAGDVRKAAGHFHGFGATDTGHM